MDKSGQVYSLDERRKIVFCSLVFDSLTELEDVSWMKEHFDFVESLRNKYGFRGVAHCKLYHASCGSGIPSHARMERFDFEAQDSFLAKMHYLAKTYLDSEYVATICKACRIGGVT